jgi:hypothetical protein
MRSSHILYSIIFLLAIQGCEEEFIPVGSNESEYVVEGYVEAGEGALPVYVLLTKTFSFYNSIGRDQLAEIFVKDALVSVQKDNEPPVQLTEICLNDLPPAFQKQAAELFGVQFDSVSGLYPDICAYIDVNGDITGAEGSEYHLMIEVAGSLITATTFIPEFVGLDSIWFTEPPGEPNDTLAEMNCLITDPEGLPNYYRYLTAVNSRPLISNFGSVTDDAFFDGKEFEFPLQKAEYETDSSETLDFNTFGLWERGDTSTLKWCCIDKPHFDFWLTFETNRNNQGPFSSYNRVAFNINGGIGIWGGYSVHTYEQIVPLK